MNKWKVAYAVLAVVLMFAANILMQAAAQKPKNPEKTESYTRPKPTRPIKPQIPSVNRYLKDKVFLEQADSLFTSPVYPGQDEKQTVKGNVIFRHGGMMMYCDSAYYYPELNALDAFGNVRMNQGDTLKARAHMLIYDGEIELAKLRCGPSQRQVVLENRSVVLTTDSLDYDSGRELGWYDTGGKIVDDVNELTSLIGFYSTSSKEAEFYGDVRLINIENGNQLLSDTLYYNTDTHIANIVSPTRIMSESDTILTSQGWYDTETDAAELTSRSLIVHKDSNNNVTTLEGDSIVYDKKQRVSYAYMFSDISKHPRPMVLNDTAQKTMLIGGFGMYNDSTRDAYATTYPLLIDYSRSDTLFLRADTIFTAVKQQRIMPPLSDLRKAELDSIFQVKLDSLQNAIEAFKFTNPDDSLPPPISEDALRELVFARDSSEIIEKDYRIALAYNRARFFNQDMQGVADSMAYIEKDSILYMCRKPVVWTGERQVSGNKINIHMNDSTADWAHLPETGMMVELVDEDFYNQLSGKTMMAWFENDELKKLDVDGNVVTIMLPSEADSTYNKLIRAESAYLSLDMNGSTLEHLKMWPDVSGTVTPLFMVKQNQKYLPGFQWLEAIRPRREWYGDSWHWDDELGELPEELEKYFNPSGASSSPQLKPRESSQEAEPEVEAEAEAEAEELETTQEQETVEEAE